MFCKDLFLVHLAELRINEVIILKESGVGDNNINSSIHKLRRKTIKMVAITSPRVVIADTNVGNLYDFYEYPDTSCGVTTLTEIYQRNVLV